MFEALGFSFGATLAGCLVLVLVTGSAAYFLMRDKKASILENNGDTMGKVSFQQMQTIISEEMKNVCELVTVRKNFISTIDFAEDKKIPLLNVHMPGSDRKISLTYSGSIVCGCDLSGIRFSRDEQFENRVKILVPQSRILDIYADVKSFKIHHHDAGIFAKDIEIEDQNSLVNDDLENYKQRAIREGILTKANENVYQMLTKIISTRGLNRSFDLEIVFLNQNDSISLNAPKD